MIQLPNQETFPTWNYTFCISQAKLRRCELARSSKATTQWPSLFWALLLFFLCVEKTADIWSDPDAAYPPHAGRTLSHVAIFHPGENSLSWPQPNQSNIFEDVSLQPRRTRSQLQHHWTVDPSSLSSKTASWCSFNGKGNVSYLGQLRPNGYRVRVVTQRSQVQFSAPAGNVGCGNEWTVAGIVWVCVHCVCVHFSLLCFCTLMG